MSSRTHPAFRHDDDDDLTAALAGMLDRAAHRVAERGTRTEARLLEAIAAAGGSACPGAAEALVDWDGSETARLRAFGIMHGVVLRATRRERSWLLGRLLGTDDLDLAG